VYIRAENLEADGVISSSPLNGQAAELWDKDPAEYKRLVLARHKAPEELDA
jgi:ubiquitin-conjugating enzyme E2 C